MRFRALVVVVCLLAGCTGESTTDPTEPATPDTSLGMEFTPEPTSSLAPVEGGSIFLAADEPPVTLNAAATDGNAAINSFIYAAVLSPLWRITPDFTYEPWLLDGEPEVATKPFRVTYTLKDGLEWNDGWPLTTDDVVFTHDTIMNRKFDIATRRGHELVRRVEVLDKRRVQFIFRRPYAEWRTMFSQPEEAILPKHVLRSANFDTVWDKEITASSGPFEFDSWDEGRLTLKRNEGYWGPKASLDEIAITFYPDTASKVAALQEGEADVLYAAPQPGLLTHLETMDGVDVEVTPSTAWEHIDFNTTTPPLDKVFVRQAIAKAINRKAILETTAVPLDPDATLLNSVVALADQPGYADRWSTAVPYDPQAAEQLLVRHRCRKRAGTYWCQGTPLELDFVTTAESPVRLQLFDLVQADLAAIGITLNSKAASSQTIFRPEFLASTKDWDLFEFAHRGGESMVDALLPWRCTSAPSINNSKYCNRAVDKQLDAAERSADDRVMVDHLAAAERLIARDVPAIPLYQQPSYLAWRSTLAGPQHNTSEWGPLWNVGDWVLLQ
jgi:peptide/nickel transport system substrate-binding protein